jgi:selenocysteine-specific elongation factor
VLARELAIDEPALVRALSPAVDAGTVAKRAGWYASPTHVPQPTDAQQAFFAELLPAQASNPLPVPYAGAALVVRRSHVPGVQAAFDALLARGELVRVGEHLYRGEQVAAIRARLTEALTAEGEVTPARFRDLVGTSRKYAVPLLEYFDRAGVTVRRGDARVAGQ